MAALVTLSIACSLPAFGDDAYQQTLKRDGRELTVSISADFEPAQREQLTAWIAFIADALAEVYGHWPRRSWTVSVAPVSAADHDPIPWAEVRRGAVDVVEFYTAPRASSGTLIREWTGYHELAHLLIPYRGWGDAWFSEGLASYYQNILQARSGVLTEQEFWQKLYEGFRRGRAESQFDGQTLESVSDAMRREGGFMRVYWSGAWYFLTADIRLRQQSGGKLTLDQALKRLNDCCADQRLPVADIVRKLDALNEAVLFTPLFEQVKTSRTVPDFEQIFASLGVSVVDDRVRLQQAGPGARLRREVIKPKQL